MQRFSRTLRRHAVVVLFLKKLAIIVRWHWQWNLLFVPILAAFQSDPKIQTQEDWQDRRAPLLKARFQSEIYGAMPAAVGYEIVSREVLQRPEKGAIGTIERISIALKTTQPGPWTGGRPIVDLILMTPKGKGHGKRSHKPANAAGAGKADGRSAMRCGHRGRSAERSCPEPQAGVSIARWRR